MVWPSFSPSNVAQTKGTKMITQAQSTFMNVSIHLMNIGHDETTSTLELATLCNATVEDTRDATETILREEIQCGMLIDSMANVTSNFEIMYNLDHDLVEAVAAEIINRQLSSRIQPTSEALKMVLGGNETKALDYFDDTSFERIMSELGMIGTFTSKGITQENLEACFFHTEDEPEDDSEAHYDSQAFEDQVYQLLNLENKERAHKVILALFKGMPCGSHMELSDETMNILKSL